MSLRRTPGVICQCQGTTPVDEGTLSLTMSGPPGPSGDGVSAFEAAADILGSVAGQTPISTPWERVRLAGSVARAGIWGPGMCLTRVTMAEAVYGFAVRQVASQYLNVREDGENSGTEVEGFQDSVGAPDGSPWCAAFVCHCHFEAGDFLCGQSTCPRTAASSQMIFQGRTLSNRTFSKKSVTEGREVPIAGDVFVMVWDGSPSQLDAGKQPKFVRGLTGLVISYHHETRMLTTIEGNTNDGGSREGDGVYIRTTRMKSSKLWGFMRPRIVW